MLILIAGLLLRVKEGLTHPVRDAVSVQMTVTSKKEEQGVGMRKQTKVKFLRCGYLISINSGKTLTF